MKKAIISLLMMEAIEGVVLHQEFIDNVSQILAVAAEEDLNGEACNPCYNSSNTKNVHYGYSPKKATAIDSTVPEAGYTSKYPNQSKGGKAIDSDADVKGRNKALGGAASLVEADCEADAECNPSYNSSYHPNNHYGYKNPVKSAAIGAYVAEPQSTSLYPNQSAGAKAIDTDADLN